MNSHCDTSLASRQRGRVGPVVRALCLATGLAACSGLLDVKNPNNVNATDLDNPAAGFAMANGALSALAYGWGAILTEYATATDELTWTGSRDGFRELDVGTLTNALGAGWPTSRLRNSQGLTRRARSRAETTSLARTCTGHWPTQ